MTTPKKKRKPGRPPKMRDGRRINLYLPQAVVDRLQKLGEGNVSLGVVRAIELINGKGIGEYGKDAKIRRKFPLRNLAAHLAAGIKVSL